MQYKNPLRLRLFATHAFAIHVNSEGKETEVVEVVVEEED